MGTLAHSAHCLITFIVVSRYKQLFQMFDTNGDGMSPAFRAEGRGTLPLLTTFCRWCSPH